MQQALQVIEREPVAMLPALVTASDVREVVQLLKKKPEGIIVVELPDAVRKRLFDPRKVAAYELWGIISKDGARIGLSQLGRDFATKFAPEAMIYRVILDNTPPYHAVLEWIHQQNLELVTHANVVEYWRDKFPEALRPGERSFEEQVVSFFQLCHAAEIGAATTGRKGQPSRLRIDRNELIAYLHSSRTQASERIFADDDQLGPGLSAVSNTASAHRQRVFISTPENVGVARSIQDALQLADIESEVVERGAEDGDELVPARAFRAMRQCNAGIIVLSSADCHRDETGKEVLDQRVLIEIGAAFVHFARRVILLQDRQVPLPFNLDGFPLFELEGGDLTWETGLRLIKAIKLFQTESQPTGSRPPEPG